MNFKQILSIIAIFSLVILVSYFLSKKEVKNFESVKPVEKIESAPEATFKPKVTFIELGSVNCAPCIMMAKIMDEIEKEYEGQVLVRFHDVNSLLGRPNAQKYRIRVIPTQVFLDKDGNEYFRHEGFFPKEELIKVLQMQGVK